VILCPIVISAEFCFRDRQGLTLAVPQESDDEEEEEEAPKPAAASKKRKKVVLFPGHSTTLAHLSPCCIAQTVSLMLCVGL